MDDKKVRVLIVDDSKAICQFLTNVLSSDPQLEVVGHALDPYEARNMIKTMRPDVITLDVEMPKMDGITFLRNLMRLRPMPVVMLSSLTAAGAEVTLDALSIGAVDFLVKRHPAGQFELKQYANEIIRVVKGAARTRVSKSHGVRRAATEHSALQDWCRKASAAPRASHSITRIIAIGASTGGPEAIREVLENLYSKNSTVVLSQHMPERFMPAFARRLNSMSRFEVVEATDGGELRPGYCYVAPGDQHLTFKRELGNLVACLNSDEPCNGHRPSVDVMYQSLAKAVADAAIGVLLTGMGADGAAGLKAMHDSGCFTLAQDEKSSAVWGMPGRAVRLGAADAVLPLHDVAPTLQAVLEG